MEEAKRLHEERNKRFIIEQRDKRIRECKIEIEKYDRDIKQAEERVEQVKDDCNEREARLVVLGEKIENFEEYRQDELEKKKVEVELDKAEEDFQRIEDEIKAAIESTSVDDGNVAGFLRLTQKLLNATLSNQQQANRLS